MKKLQQFCRESWNFRKFSHLSLVILWGLIKTYCTWGMNINLPAIFCSAEGFLDAATRAFFAEFNIWNSNVGLCAFAILCTCHSVLCLLRRRTGTVQGVNLCWFLEDRASQSRLCKYLQINTNHWWIILWARYAVVNFAVEFGASGGTAQEATLRGRAT